MFSVSAGGNLSTGSPVRGQKRFQSALRKYQRFTRSLWAGTLSLDGVMREGDVVTAGTFLEHVCSAVGCLDRSPGWCRRFVGERRSWLFLWVIQQSKVVGCCLGVQALTVRRCFCNPNWHVGSLSHQHTERRDGRWCESRAWRFIDFDDLISCDVYALPLWLSYHSDWPATIPTARGQTWQDRDSHSGLIQLVESWVSLACLQLCSGSPGERWWKPCSYRLAAQWWRSCSQWAPRCSAGVCWVVGHLQGVLWPNPCRTHPAQVAVAALILTGLFDICSNVVQGGPREGTYPPQPWLQVTQKFITLITNDSY